MGKIADAYVEISAEGTEFNKTVNVLSEAMRKLQLNADGLARVTQAAANETGGIASQLLNTAAAGLRVYATYTLAARTYAVAAKAASVIDPFGSIKSNTISLVGEGFKSILAFAAKIPPKFLLAAGAVTALGVAYLTFRASVARASELAETVDFSKIVLGEQGFKLASDAADRLSWSYGVLRQETLKTATQAASMAKNMGLSKDEAAALGVQVTQLAADLSSARNTTMAEAANAINAAFRGEADPIEVYGVSIREATIEAEALASGLARTKQEIDDNVRFQARWNLILKQTADSQGNLSQTSSSLANVTRNFRGQFAEASTIIGEAFLPIAGSAARVILSIATATRVAATGFSYMVKPIGMAADAINGLYDSITRLTGGNREAFKLFDATAEENEAKRIERFRKELAAEEAKRMQDAADLQLRIKHGLLNEEDRKKMADAAEAENKVLRDTFAQQQKMQQEQEDIEKRMIDAEAKNEKAIQDSIKAEKERIDEMNRGFDESLARKLEDIELERRRREEERNASFMFADLASARDKMFSAAVEKNREEQRTMEDFAIDFQRRQEDMDREIAGVQGQGALEREAMKREGSLTQRGLQGEVDRIVKALSELRLMWGMS